MRDMLLEARKRPALEAVYARYGRRLLRRGFARIWLGGEPWPDADGPTIAFLNHSAWWDPILTLFLSHDLFRRDGYGIMHGAQLRRYPFFRRIGCFGVVGDGFEEARALVGYAASVLREGRRRTLWIFPQGELMPARVPLSFRSGAARFARAVPEAPLLPVAVRYEFRHEQRPEVFARVGASLTVSARESALQLTRRLEQRMRHELAALDDDLARTAAGGCSPADMGYRVVLEGASSLSALYDRTIGRLPMLLRRRAESG
jgi:1-acyl-sn-glycerol-3-phosphate acyltransferase